MEHRSQVLRTLKHPSQAILVNGRVKFDIKYRDAHQACPFSTKITTASPELLAGRRKRSMKTSAAPNDGKIPMNVRKPLADLYVAQDIICPNRHTRKEMRRIRIRHLFRSRWGTRRQRAELVRAKGRLVWYISLGTKALCKSLHGILYMYRSTIWYMYECLYYQHLNIYLNQGKCIAVYL